MCSPPWTPPTSSALGHWTTENWNGPLKGIIPWVSNAFTEAIIRQARALLGEDLWGFLMLGGMSGGGMAFFVAPARHDEFQEQILAIMKRVKSSLDDAMPFAMEPVVYDFRINPQGTWADLQTGGSAMMPPRYYSLQAPRMIAAGTAELAQLRKADFDHFANHSQETGELLRVFRTMINHLFPVTRGAGDATTAHWDEQAQRIREENGFDPVQHERLREDLQRGRIGLARNRLPVDLEIRDVDDADLIPAHGHDPPRATANSARRRSARARSPSSRSPPVSAAAGPPAPGWSRPSIRSSPWPAGTAASWRSTWPRPAQSPGGRGPPSPTS